MKKLLVIFVLVLSVLFVFSISYADSTWSEWQDEVIEATDGIKVETQQVPSSYKMVVYVCTDNNSPSLRSYYNYRNGTLRAKWEDEWTVETFNSAQKIPNGTYWDYANNVAGYIRSGDAYTLDYMPYYVEKINYKTQYRYKEIQKQTEQKINNNVGDNIARKTTEAIEVIEATEASNNRYYEVEQETTKKKKKKSTGKKMNGGAKVWNESTTNQNKMVDNYTKSVTESDNYIVVDEVIDENNTIYDAHNIDDKYFETALDNIFDNSSYSYNKQVSILAAELCDKIYDKENVTNTLYNKYGFSNVKTYNYSLHDSIAYINANCFIVGHRKVRRVNGNKTILCIVARGSQCFTGELEGDLFKNDVIKTMTTGTIGNNILGVNVYDNVYNFYEQIRIGVENYFAKNPELRNEKDLKILITGHSLGGAAANLYGAKLLNDIAIGNCICPNLRKEDVFTYTFGAIKVINCNANANLTVGYENIYNIYNIRDSFGPLGSWAILNASGYYQKFGNTNLYGGDLCELIDKPLFFIDNHDMKNYIKAVNSYDFTKEINSVLDITSTFDGRLVKIFSKETNNFVSDESGTVHADGEGGEGIFIAQCTSDGWVGFKRINGNWLSVQEQGYVRAEGTNLSSWECFRVYKYNGNMYLFSQKEGKFVQVINDGDQVTNPLCATRSVNEGLDNASWERFDIYFVDGK